MNAIKKYTALIFIASVTLLAPYAHAMDPSQNSKADEEYKEEASHTEPLSEEQITANALLLEAAIANDIEKLYQAFDNNADLECKDDTGATALMRAIGAKKLVPAKLLIANNANIHAKDCKGFTALHFACAQSSPDIVELLLTHKADINEHTNSESCPPLDAATKAGSLDIVELLLDNKANIHIQSNTPALAIAALNGHNAMVRTLLTHKANVNHATKKNNTTALSAACTKDHTEIIELLLAHKADPSITSMPGVDVTPLFFTVNAQTTTAAELLCAKNADVNYRAKDGSFPLGRAVLRSRAPMVRTLLTYKANTETADPRTGHTSLMLASIIGDEEIARLLLEHKAQPNALDTNNHTALMHAFRKGNTHIVHLLQEGAATPRIDILEEEYKEEADSSEPLSEDRLKALELVFTGIKTGQGHLVHEGLRQQAPVNGTNANGATLLIAAAQSDSIRATTLLLKHKANVHLKEPINGLDALTTAAGLDHRYIATILLQYNANVDAVDKHGVTPLLAASSRGHTAMTELLLAHNATVDPVDVGDKTPLIMAAQKNHEDTVRILLAHKAAVDRPSGPDKATALLLALLNAPHTNTTVQQLLDTRANPNQIDANKTAPLHAAILSESPCLAHIELLIDRKADPNAAMEGATPLFLATNKGVTKIVGKLLEAKAHPFTDKPIPQPLLRASFRGDTESVKMLLEHKADCDVLNDENRTSLILAARGGNTETIQELLSNGARSDITDKNGFTAFATACQKRHVKAAKILALLGTQLEHININFSEENDPCTLNAARSARIRSALLAIHAITNTIKNQTWHPEWLLESKILEPYLPPVLCALTDAYATHYTQDEYLNMLVKKLITRNQQPLQKKNKPCCLQ